MQPTAPSFEGGTHRGADADVTEVIVIGAGITGLTTALALQSAGRRVTVLDARPFNDSESGRTTAHLSEVQGTRFSTLLRRFGVEDTRLFIDGQRHAITQIETWVRDLGIDCGFERLPGFLYAAADDVAQRRALEAEAAATAQLGYGDIVVDTIPVDAMAVGAMLARFPVAGALRFPVQAQLRPGAYLAALEARVRVNGGAVRRGVRVDAVDPIAGQDRCRVATSQGALWASHVVVATHVPIGDQAAAAQPSIDGKLSAHRSYAIAAPAAGPLGGLFWDLADPYHHARTVQMAGRCFLIVGGGDHRVGEEHVDTQQVLAALADFARRQFGALTISHRWSGQIIESADGLPYVGAGDPEDRVLYATGLSGNGFTSGTLAGLVLADRVQGRDNRWARLLSPQRAGALASITRRVGRNLVAAKQRLAGRLERATSRGTAPAATAALDALPAAAGMVTHHRGEALAIYRDPAGGLRALGAACPQGRGSVRWNHAERSWDCPSCGSRFGVSGEVLNGPAARGLMQREPPEARAAHAPPRGECVGDQSLRTPDALATKVAM